jgi:hypothetical protein
MKTFTYAFVFFIVAWIANGIAGEINGSHPLSIGRDQIVVLIQGKAYSLRGSEDEYQKGLGRKLPPFREEDDVQMVDFMRTEKPSNDMAASYLSIGANGYFSVNKDGQVIAVKKPDARSRWIVEKIGSFSTPGDDNISVYEILNATAKAPPDGYGLRHIGVSDRLLLLKDKDGREHRFYPLKLMQSIRAARFWTNDYSGK